MEKIDKLDKQILEIISQNARIPFKDVAAECGVSRAAIHQRVQRLIDLGVIIGSGYRYDDLRRWACGKRLDASVVVRAGIIPDASLYTTEQINDMKEELGLTAEGALDIYGKRVKTQAVFEEPKHYLLSIPINEISINPNLAPNNPGW